MKHEDAVITESESVAGWISTAWTPTFGEIESLLYPDKPA